MATAKLDIFLDAIAENWRALDARSGEGTETAAVVKADAYGLGAERVAPRLAGAGARTFFVATAEEGATVRHALGEGISIAVFSGHMEGDTDLIRAHDLIPMLNSREQVIRHLDALPDTRFGVQLDSGMNRLGMEPGEWDGLKSRLLELSPWLVMSHLACADEPDHPMNAQQLAAFKGMTDGIDARRSLSATGGILLGEEYHFDLTRPGVGLYGGLPFATALQAVQISIPVIQCRDVALGESVGYGNSWIASHPSRIATIASGYADGLLRSMSGNATLFAAGKPCPLVGRVSMDLITVDISHLEEDPETFEILGPYQGVDALAEAAGTIGYEILTSLGARYSRNYNRASY